MKITPFLDKKINIYDSEMSVETIESYEKFYKNQNECDDEKKLDCGNDKKLDCENEKKLDCENEKKLDCDDVNKAVESNGHDSNNDQSQNLSDTNKCDSSNDSDRKRTRNLEATSDSLPCKKRKKEFEPPKLREDNRDIFCWRCHKYVVETDVIPCYFCPRVYHLKCVHIQEKPSGFWLCTECDAISAAENPDKISPALSKLQKKDLAELLMFVLKRMRQHEGSSHYENPVDLESYPDYKDYIVKPMYLALLENNVKNLKYSSCESFLADTKWMVHNSYVFNTVHSELTLYAKAMMKNAKHECDEIVNCPDCYLHANTLEEDKWFIEPCDKPHVLVWARLKGFPYWPCKVMKANGTNVDVRFFGDHNKSLVPVECCYLYSKQMPSKQKKVDELEIAIKEASQHIKRLEERFHVFQYAPLKTMYNPKEEEEQRKLLLPYHDKSFFIKVKDREKLFDPKVINNIFEDPPSYVNTDEKEEPETNTISESPNALELKNKKIVLKPHSEELSPYRLSSINRNMKSPPCSKPTIIIEDSDSDILSQNSFNHSRQPGVTGCEKLSSPCTSSKAKSIVSEKHVISPSAISLKHEHGNGTVEIAKDVNCKLNNHIFKSKMNTTNHSTEEQDNADDDSRIDLTNDKLKSDDKKICFTSEKVNRLTLTNPCLDKYNNNHFSDKLRINSNAKLINIITDNPALINNYIFKPMVVIQKLKDDVFRDYSNNISKKKEITAADKPSKAEEKCSSDIPSCDNGDKVCLNFDLLNGNLSDLVSLTKIDLDKEELSQENLSDNKEAENIDCDVLETSDGSFSSLPRQIVKSEKVDDDEQVDSDYIERLSKSFLEPSLDCNDTHHAEENGIISDSEKGSGERILVVDRENESLKKDEPRMRYNSSVHNSPNEVINLDIIEDIKKQNLEKSNGAGPGVDLIIPKTDVSRKAIYFCEKTGQFEEQDEEENEDRISLNVNSREIKSNEVEKTVGSNLVENEKLSLDNVETSYSEENIECPNSNKKCESSVKDMLQKEEHNSKSLNDFCPKGDNLGNGSLSDNSTMKEPDNHCEQSVQEKEIILQKKANGLQLHGDSDCEIIKVLYPAGSNIPKHLGLKRVKTSGGVIKKVLAGKSGMILAGSKDRQSLNTSAKRIIGTIPKKLSSKTKLSVDCLKQLNISGNPVKNNPASNCLPPSNKGAVSLKDVLNAVNMDDNEMLNLEVEAILNKLEKIEGKGRLLQVLKEELEKFQEQCKNKIEVYKNAFIEEMDSLYTMEKQRWIQETMNVSENESRMMVDEIKKKQWCILCLNEAKFHCCWSTSYCSEKCQLADWPVHTKTCTQYSMRIGDPDLRLSPELRKIFKGENDILNHKIKDLLESDRFNSNTSKMNLCSPSCSGTSMTSSSDVSAKDSMVTSPKSSTIYVQKNGSKQDIRGFDNSGNQVMKIVSNPGVYLSGMVAPPNQTKNIIHVTKHNSAKSNVVLQDQSSPGLSGNNKPVLFSVPLANRSSAHVSLGKTSYKTSGNSFNRHNTPVFKRGQKLVLPKSFLPTKVIKKTVPLLAHKNISCVQDNNNAAFMNAKPLYISMQNISRDNCESSDDLRDPLEIKNDTIPLPEQPKLLSDRNSIPSNRDTSKPAQSFLIVEKSGETAQYTYKIGFKEDIEKMSQVSVMNPLSVQKSTVCAVSPLPYPVICNTPSTSTE